MKKILATFVLAITALLSASAYAGTVFVDVYNHVNWSMYLFSDAYVHVIQENGALTRIPNDSSKSLPAVKGHGYATINTVDTDPKTRVGGVTVYFDGMYYNMCENTNLKLYDGTLTITITSVSGKPNVPVCHAKLVSGGKTTYPPFPSKK